MGIATITMLWDVGQAQVDMIELIVLQALQMVPYFFPSLPLPNPFQFPCRVFESEVVLCKFVEASVVVVQHVDVCNSMLPILIWLDNHIYVAVCMGMTVNWSLCLIFKLLSTLLVVHQCNQCRSCTVSLCQCICETYVSVEGHSYSCSVNP